MCSLSEPGLWDYVITNETMEGTGKQLADIAGRALAGQIGNGIAELQDPDVSQTLANQTVCPPAQLFSQPLPSACLPACQQGRMEA